MRFKETKINAAFTINATYDDRIMISIQDKTSGVRFVELEVSREQFINAAMNKLADSNTSSAIVRGLDIVGKTMEMKTFEFPVSDWNDKEEAKSYAKSHCPEGWIPDLGFSSQDSFFNTKNDSRMARTIIRRWV